MIAIKCPYCKRRNFLKSLDMKGRHAVDLTCKFCDKGFSASPRPPVYKEERRGRPKRA